MPDLNENPKFVYAPPPKDDNDRLRRIESDKVCNLCGKPLDKMLLNCPKTSTWMVLYQQCQCVIDRKKAEESEAKARADEARRQTRLARCKIPDEYKCKTLDNFERRHGTETAVDVAKWYIEHFPTTTNVLFIGATGSGKTHLACAIGNEIVKTHSVRFVVVGDLYREVLQTYTTRDKSELDVIDEYLKCSFLIIDDIGTEPMTPKCKGIFHSIVDYRIRNAKPTIMTSNLNTDELAEYLDSRTIDRIIGDFKKYTLTATSYRREKSAARKK